MNRLGQLPVVRRCLGLSVVASLLAASIGCNGDPAQREGGANTTQARENRKLAEASMAEGVKAGANEVHASHPDIKQKNGIARVIEKFENRLTQSVGSAASAPPSPPPAAPPAPAVVQQNVSVERTTRGETRVAGRNPRTGEPTLSPVVISERVQTEIPYATEAEADMRALEEAQNLIEKRLAELDPPVKYRPAIPVIKNEYVRRDSRLVRLPNEQEEQLLETSGAGKNRKYVEYTVELTADQVRELRTRNRVADGLRGLGVIAAIALAGFFFLRLDEWSKGYLTSWLALAAAALGGGIVAAVVFV